MRDFFAKLKIDKVHADLATNIETLMSTEAARFIPYEIIFPPLPAPRITELEAIRLALSTEAQGTGLSIFNAFGTHFNPELPALDSTTLLNYLRAFLVQAEQLSEVHKVDASRRILPFIDPFPKDYIKEILNPDYHPNLPTLIDDYLDLNATRNRPLDMLPIFAYLAPEQIKARLPKEKISARPTLHYRLPNCQINETNWSITAEWNHWVRLVEPLANNPDKLNKRCSLYLWELRHPIRARLRRFFK
ncbi:MAG: alpha-L-fucosidase [Puniceicoccaceae bacterium]|nr:MAG: alpha-L-fucosidase [Puniceicoccaceae bacterium]